MSHKAISDPQRQAKPDGRPWRVAFVKESTWTHAEEYARDAITDWVAKLAQQSTHLLLPLCDLFVTSQSSTITYASACGKPIINFDVGRYRHTVYSAPGIITVENKGEYLRELTRLSSKPTARAELAAIQAASAPKWGRLDGCAGGRLLALFDTLIARYQTARHN